MPKQKYYLFKNVKHSVIMILVKVTEDMKYVLASGEGKEEYKLLKEMLK